MSTRNSKYSMSVQASTKHLAEVRDFVAKHAAEFGFKKQDVADIRLAVDEAYTNIIKHSYKNDDRQSVEIEMEFDNGELWISLLDTGESFDPSNYSKPDVRQKIKEKKRGGVGVFLIKQLMDEVKYLNDGPTNEIRMSKKR